MKPFGAWFESPRECARFARQQAARGCRVVVRAGTVTWWPS
jgi:hypothetical protein